MTAQTIAVPALFPAPEADADIARLHVAHWRTALLGAMLMTSAVAWGFDPHLPDRRIWLWGGLSLSVYLAMAGWCLRLERDEVSRTEPACAQSPVTFLVCANGVLWGSLGWWLPADDRAMHLAAALVGGVAIVGAASASDCARSLRLTVVPALAGVVSSLLWQAHLPFAAAASLLLGGVLLRYGLLLQRARQDAVVQRRCAQALSQRLIAEQMRLRGAEREQTLLVERQRLLRDMHDGLGASLTSALKMMEQGRLDMDEAADLLRECLEDLRLVIDSLEPLGHDIVTLLATLRFRIGHRLERAGIRVDWQVGDVPPLPWLGAPQALEVLRIVQEALTNVLRHARASRVMLQTSVEGAAASPTGLRVVIEDDGVGFDPQVATPGRGLAHLQHRARRLGGRIDIGPAASRGTRLVLHLPVAGPCAAA